MGFFTNSRRADRTGVQLPSQSLSGWDGVFHAKGEKMRGEVKRSQSLSGWDGVFPWEGPCGQAAPAAPVAIPFRVGWGFSLRSLGR